MRRDSLARWGRCVALGLSVMVAGVRLTSGAELVLHDNFDTSDRIRPEKWYGSATHRPNTILEAARFVADGTLHLSAVGYGDMESNTGRHTGSFGLGVKTSHALTTLQAELTVTHAIAEPCAENAESTQGRAQLVGFFFNDGSRRRKGDLTGDVVAVMEKVVDSKDGKFIRALVLRCTSWSCHTGQTIKALLFQRTWMLSEPHVLRIAWEPLQFQFVFTVNPGAEAEETRRIAYDKALRPRKLSTLQRQRIRVRHHGANCQAERRGVLMHVAVDNVYVRVLDPKVIAVLSSQEVISAGHVRQRREATDGLHEWP
jgi:hypothetical protein